MAANSEYAYGTENTCLSIPETTIGLVPSGGSSYHLSRMRNGVGMYLALTGGALHGEEVYWSGLSPHYTSSDIAQNESLDIAGEPHREPFQKFEMESDKQYLKSLRRIRQGLPMRKHQAVSKGMPEDANQEELQRFFELNTWYTLYSSGHKKMADQFLKRGYKGIGMLANNESRGKFLDFYMGDILEGRDLPSKPDLANQVVRDRMSGLGLQMRAIGLGECPEQPSRETAYKLAAIRRAFSGQAEKGDPVYLASKTPRKPTKTRMSWLSAIADKEWDPRWEDKLPQPLEDVLLNIYVRLEQAPARNPNVHKLITRTVREGVYRAWPFGMLDQLALDKLCLDCEVPDDPQIHRQVAEGVILATSKVQNVPCWALTHPWITARDRQNREWSKEAKRVYDSDDGEEMTPKLAGSDPMYSMGWEDIHYDIYDTIEHPDYAVPVSLTKSPDSVLPKTPSVIDERPMSIKESRNINPFAEFHDEDSTYDERWRSFLKQQRYLNKRSRVPKLSVRYFEEGVTKDLQGQLDELGEAVKSYSESYQNMLSSHGLDSGPKREKYAKDLKDQETFLGGANVGDVENVNLYDGRNSVQRSSNYIVSAEDEKLSVFSRSPTGDKFEEINGLREKLGAVGAVWEARHPWMGATILGGAREAALTTYGEEEFSFLDRIDHGNGITTLDSTINDVSLRQGSLTAIQQHILDALLEELKQKKKLDVVLSHGRLGQYFRELCSPSGDASEKQMQQWISQIRSNPHSASEEEAWALLSSRLLSAYEESERSLSGASKARPGSSAARQLDMIKDTINQLLENSRPYKSDGKGVETLGNENTNRKHAAELMSDRVYAQSETDTVDPEREHLGQLRGSPNLSVDTRSLVSPTGSSIKMDTFDSAGAKNSVFQPLIDEFSSGYVGEQMKADSGLKNKLDEILTVTVTAKNEEGAGRSNELGVSPYYTRTTDAYNVPLQAAKLKKYRELTSTNGFGYDSDALQEVGSSMRNTVDLSVYHQRVDDLSEDESTSRNISLAAGELVDSNDLSSVQSGKISNSALSGNGASSRALERALEDEWFSWAIRHGAVFQDQFANIARKSMNLKPLANENREKTAGEYADHLASEFPGSNRYDAQRVVDILERSASELGTTPDKSKILNALKDGDVATAAEAVAGQSLGPELLERVRNFLEPVTTSQSKLSGEQGSVSEDISDDVTKLIYLGNNPPALRHSSLWRDGKIGHPDAPSNWDIVNLVSNARRVEEIPLPTAASDKIVESDCAPASTEGIDVPLEARLDGAEENSESILEAVTDRDMPGSISVFTERSSAKQFYQKKAAQEEEIEKAARNAGISVEKMKQKLEAEDFENKPTELVEVDDLDAAETTRNLKEIRSKAEFNVVQRALDLYGEDGAKEAAVAAHDTYGSESDEEAAAVRFNAGKSVDQTKQQVREDLNPMGLSVLGDYDTHKIASSVDPTLVDGKLNRSHSPNTAVQSDDELYVPREVQEVFGKDTSKVQTAKVDIPEQFQNDRALTGAGRGPVESESSREDVSPSSARENVPATANGLGSVADLGRPYPRSLPEEGEQSEDELDVGGYLDGKAAKQEAELLREVESNSDMLIQETLKEINSENGGNATTQTKRSHTSLGSSWGNPLSGKQSGPKSDRSLNTLKSVLPGQEKEYGGANSLDKSFRDDEAVIEDDVWGYNHRKLSKVLSAPAEPKLYEMFDIESGTSGSKEGNVSQQSEPFENVFGRPDQDVIADELLKASAERGRELQSEMDLNAIFSKVGSDGNATGTEKEGMMYGADADSTSRFSSLLRSNPELIGPYLREQIREDASRAKLLRDFTPDDAQSRNEGSVVFEGPNGGVVYSDSFKVALTHDPETIVRSFGLPRTPDTLAAAEKVASHYQHSDESRFAISHPKSVEEIYRRLRAEDTPFARETIKALDRVPPLALKATHRLLVWAASQPFDKVMQEEWRATKRLLDHEDFRNSGVHGGTNPPVDGWAHSNLAAVSAAEVNHLFAPLEDELKLEGRAQKLSEVSDRHRRLKKWNKEMIRYYESGLAPGPLGEMFARRYTWDYELNDHLEFAPSPSILPHPYGESDDERELIRYTTRKLERGENPEEGPGRKASSEVEDHTSNPGHEANNRQISRWSYVPKSSSSSDGKDTTKQNPIRRQLNEEATEYKGRRQNAASMLADGTVDPMQAVCVEQGALSEDDEKYDAIEIKDQEEEQENDVGRKISLERDPRTLQWNVVRGRGHYKYYGAGNPAIIRGDPNFEIEDENEGLEDMELDENTWKELVEEILEMEGVDADMLSCGDELVEKQTKDDRSKRRSVIDPATLDKIPFDDLEKHQRNIAKIIDAYNRDDKKGLRAAISAYYDSFGHNVHETSQEKLDDTLLEDVMESDPDKKKKIKEELEHRSMGWHDSVPADEDEVEYFSSFADCKEREGHLLSQSMIRDDQPLLEGDTRHPNIPVRIWSLLDNPELLREAEELGILEIEFNESGAVHVKPGALVRDSVKEGSAASWIVDATSMPDDDTAAIWDGLFAQADVESGRMPAKESVDEKIEAGEDVDPSWPQEIQWYAKALQQQKSKRN